MSKEVKRYDALRDSAKKATPGPWRIEDDEDSAAGAVYITQDTPDWREPIARLYGWHDQNYLELADPTTILGLLDERDALLAERDSMKKDAERYRWLRRHATLDGGSDYHFPEVHAWEYKEGAEPNEQYGSLDTAIDAAMQETNP